MPLDHYNDWRVLSPNFKQAVPHKGGIAIADPICIMRGVIWTNITGTPDPETEFDDYLGPVTGRLERVIVTPDHNRLPNSGGPGGNFSMTMFQEYAEGPKADGAEFTDTLDILNGLGAAVVQNAITHMSVYPLGIGVRSQLLPQVFVNDFLRIHFTDWDNIDGRVYVWLYFSQVAPPPTNY
jgi:hypothetical protein